MAAAAARVPRGRLASQAVLAAFLLGALWLASALHVSRSVGRCLAVEGSVWRDEECSAMIRWAGTAAVLALAYTLALCHGEAAPARRQHHQAAAGGARDDRSNREPDRNDGVRLGAAAIHALAFLQMYLIGAVLMFWGKMFRYTGARSLEENPADAVAARLFRSGPLYCNAGCLALSVVNCFSVIPFMVLRLMSFVREKCVESLAD